MSIDYIRRLYNVPAKRGQRVIYAGKPGVITGSFGSHLRIRLDGEKCSKIYHPTWDIQYQESDRADADEVVHTLDLVGDS